MILSKRQNEIVDAALHLIALGGIQNLTVKNLSAAIGVSEPALYRHFKNKSEIVAAMIERFELEVPSGTQSLHGFAAVRAFVEGRIRQVESNPDLARVMFAEELFMDDPDFSSMIFAMMHQHKNELANFFSEAQASGEIRQGIAPDMLFRIIMGPVRLLIKQWGMTKGAFDLRRKTTELLDTLLQLLQPEAR